MQIKNYCMYYIRSVLNSLVCYYLFKVSRSYHVWAEKRQPMYYNPISQSQLETLCEINDQANRACIETVGINIFHYD